MESRLDKSMKRYIHTYKKKKKKKLNFIQLCVGD